MKYIYIITETKTGNDIYDKITGCYSTIERAWRPFSSSPPVDIKINTTILIPDFNKKYCISKFIIFN